MARMGRLETRYVFAKRRIMQPVWHFLAQSTFAFGRMIKGNAVKRVPTEWGAALSGDDENEAAVLMALRFQKTQQLDTRNRNTFAVKIKA